ncbi:MAG TPA: hypothetical protein VFP61_11980 [Acidimicrobiales bacterium]|nr:hypothetical protein [Acidimicrobiales bacterium]
MRTRRPELVEEGTDAFLHALAAAGVPAAPSTSGIVELTSSAGKVPVKVIAASVVDGGRARSLVEGTDGARSPELTVVVADKVTAEARDVLRGAGVGYLDRRGALWLRGAGLFIHNTTLAPGSRSHRPPAEPIRGRVALGVALRRLMEPDAVEPIREVARLLGASPSTVHAAAGALREHALVEASGAPLVPDLFDAVAAVWRPERIPVREVPNLDDIGTEDGVAYVVSGDVAAASVGAPIVLAGGSAPDLYLATPAALRRVVRRLGRSPYDERAATVAVAPSPLVTAFSSAHRLPGPPWPVAHPVVVALDLAQDRSRGREVLSGWTPGDVRRVW